MSSPYSKKTLAIRTIEHLSMRLNTPVDVLRRVAETADSRYRIWTRPKKSGGVRTISAPEPALKQIQKKIHSLLRELEINSVAHCGIRGRSSVTNAKAHVNKKLVLNLDLTKFFPSISNHMVYRMFRHGLDCSPAVASLLTRLCTLNGEVPQGGHMSMDIANLICRPIDLRLEKLAASYGITYTRYCDDMTFSGQHIPSSFIKTAKKIVQQTGFTLNDAKEQLMGRHQTQMVTGLQVNGAHPKVPRKKQRQWRAERYVFEKYEAQSLPEKIRCRKEQQVKGRSSYVGYVEKSGTST